MFEIVPVIDLKGGVVVHASQGERSRYGPVVSRLTHSSRPGDIAAAFADLGAQHVYIADLDAIADSEPDFAAYESIAAAGLRLWLDAGVRDAADARRITDLFGNSAPLESLVIGSETLTTIAAIVELIEMPTTAKLVFSLDHKNGTPLTQISAWHTASAVDIAIEVAGLGVRRFIDLDLSKVGSGDGPQSSALAATIRDALKDSFLAIGGGVRDASDMTALAELGYDAALVATGLHNGSITADDFQNFQPNWVAET